MTDNRLGELLALYDQYVLALYHDRQDPQEPGQRAIVNDCDKVRYSSCAPVFLVQSRGESLYLHQSHGRHQPHR